MKEYRVVCTKDIYNRQTGDSNHIEVNPIGHIFKDKEEAKRKLDEAETIFNKVNLMSTNPKYSQVFHYYNFRIQSREWEDEEIAQSRD